MIENDPTHVAPAFCDRCHRAPHAGQLLHVGYERNYQWLCLWCWARKMTFVVRDAEEVATDGIVVNDLISLREIL